MWEKCSKSVKIMLFWIFDVGVVSFCLLQKIHMKSFELFSKQMGNTDKSCVGKLFIKCYIFHIAQIYFWQTFFCKGKNGEYHYFQPCNIILLWHHIRFKVLWACIAGKTSKCHEKFFPDLIILYAICNDTFS